MRSHLPRLDSARQKFTISPVAHREVPVAGNLFAVLPSPAVGGNRIISAVLCAVLVLGQVVASAARADGADTFPPLRESFDPALQRGLERVVERVGLGEAARRGRLALALVDISDLNDPRVAEVNGDKMYYAASLPKIAILLGAFVQIERGKMRLDRDTRDSLTRMIRVSSNEDATRMLNRVGKGALIDILRSERYRLYDPQVNGGLWVGKEYGRSPAYRRDPLHNLSHGATAMQVARFYYLLESGRLMSPRLSREMKTMLGDPGIRHKFVKGLANRPGARIYRKSGTWRNYHADSALVEAGKRRYIAVGLAEDARGGEWLEHLIGPMHDLVVPRRLASR
ncbi:MAG: serine hydrolase [Ectothiorhodospiraceae bacterium]|nr:serine hydrolase [Chromatiales bacterium]MCP5156014.1 serine hydrolase [Ectothiorhodospiraceae bacterium]